MASSSSSSSSSTDKVAEAHKILFEEGNKMRRSVNGAAYVDAALANATEFGMPMQQLVSEACWGSVWTRDGLDNKFRSLLNIAMLCALNRSTELATHVKGAVTNGATDVEIRETLLQAAIYCGMPAGMEGFRVAEKAIQQAKEEGRGPAK